MTKKVYKQKYFSLNLATFKIQDGIKDKKL